MNILVPFSSVEQLIPLIEAGATELFCGYVDENWKNKYQKSGLNKLLINLNKRDSLNANITDKKELQKIIDITNKYKVKLFLTINALYYSDVVWEDLKHYVSEIEEIGIKHVIVSDIALMDYITKNTKLRISVSCLNNVINSYQIDFYKQFNIERIVFPRHISINNIKELCQKYPEIDFEYFILSDKCLYDDGNCHCCHLVGPFCVDSWTSDYFSSNNELDQAMLKELENNELIYKRWAHNYLPFDKTKNRWNSIGCSLCSLYEVINIKNIKSLKIVGRGYSLNNIQYLVKTTNQAINMVQNGSTRNEICNFAREVFNNKDMCKTHNYCIVRGNTNWKK